ncbi:MAG: hypothetical protein WC375_05255 [Methanomassiliicoccales archaeon]|jgi:hypothetical protein
MPDKIDEYLPRSGRTYGESDRVVNIADVISPADGSGIAANIARKGWDRTPTSFFAADIATIASTADSAASSAIDVPANAVKAYVQLYLTGHASGSGTATAYIVASLDGTTFETSGTPLALTIGSGAKRSNVIELSLAGVQSLKVLQVHNGDPAQAITDVNVIVTFY